MTPRTRGSLLLVLGLVAGALVGVAPPAAAAAPPVPTCDRGAAYAGFTAPPGDPDAGRAYGASGPCRAVRHAPAGAPRGLVVQIAAGGWLSSPQEVSMPHLARQRQPLLAAGWEVMTVEHSPAFLTGDPTPRGPAAVTDLLQWFDRLRAQATAAHGSRYPVCVTGDSSGGHAALLLGRLRAPDCVITEGAPTRLADLPGNTRPIAVAAFGEAGLARWSPAAYGPGAYRTRLLMGHLPDDRLVPLAQLSSFAAGRGNVRPWVATPTPGTGLALLDALLPPPECQDGARQLERFFTHLCLPSSALGLDAQRGITQASIDDWRGRVTGFLRSVATGA